jgi:hypothetical protein
MSAWITSVLILLSAADEKTAGSRRAISDRDDASQRNEELQCETTIRRQRCGRGRVTNHMTVCRACFRD